ncbi:MAG: shikimate dehydrogenase [Sphingobacteriales bacterium]|nr:shikimate dehydrogenase [Sphingobacteriales bacterium]MBI3718768.1 shikimate dehydrogenase [Sphingobacteriales bacterium]
MKVYGLIGYPLSHSFSKKYFTEKFQREAVTDCVYENFPLENIELLTTLLKNPELKGLNVTIPYKEQVISFLNEQNDVVKATGACNCIKIDNGRLKGFNTDVVGFENSLKKFLQPYHNKALIFGTGGAAKAVEYVLQKLHIDYLFVSRKKGTDKTISYHELKVEILQQRLLLINTTPLGMYPKVNDCPDIAYDYLTPQHHLYDLVYNPAKTLFLQKGEAKGATVQNGYEMLILQAEESWRIWNE